MWRIADCCSAGPKNLQRVLILFTDTVKKLKICQTRLVYSIQKVCLSSIQETPTEIQISWDYPLKGNFRHKEKAIEILLKTSRQPSYVDTSWQTFPIVSSSIRLTADHIFGSFSLINAEFFKHIKLTNMCRKEQGNLCMGYE